LSFWQMMPLSVAAVATPRLQELSPPQRTDTLVAVARTGLSVQEDWPRHFMPHESFVVQVTPRLHAPLPTHCTVHELP